MSRIAMGYAQDIANAAVSHGMDAAKKALFDREDALIARLVAEQWEKFPSVTDAQKAEKGLFSSLSRFFVLTDSGRIELRLSGSVPVPHKTYDDSYSLPASAELRADIMAWALDKKAHTEEREKRRAEVKAAVLSFGTWNKLEQGWPEIWPIASKWRPAAAVRNALVSVSALNTALGLPPEEAATADETAA